MDFTCLLGGTHLCLQWIVLPICMVNQMGGQLMFWCKTRCPPSVCWLCTMWSSIGHWSSFCWVWLQNKSTKWQNDIFAITVSWTLSNKLKLKVKSVHTRRRLYNTPPRVNFIGTEMYTLTLLRSGGSTGEYSIYGWQHWPHHCFLSSVLALPTVRTILTALNWIFSYAALPLTQ